MKDNRIVIDLNKVQYCKFYYKNQWGHERPLKPKFSVHGIVKDPTDKAFGGGTLLEMSERLGVKDVWTPHVRFQLTANHSVTYSGEKAKSLYKEFNRRIFKTK